MVFMIKIIKEKLQFGKILKQRLEYIEPHRVIIKNTTLHTKRI